MTEGPVLTNVNAESAANANQSHLTFLLQYLGHGFSLLHICKALVILLGAMAQSK